MLKKGSRKMPSRKREREKYKKEEGEEENPIGWTRNRNGKNSFRWSVKSLRKRREKSFVGEGEKEEKYIYF